MTYFTQPHLADVAIREFLNSLQDRLTRRDCTGDDFTVDGEQIGEHILWMHTLSEIKQVISEICPLSNEIIRLLPLRRKRQIERFPFLVQKAIVSGIWAKLNEKLI